MKTILYILLILLSSMGCVFSSKNPDQMIQDAREDFAKKAEMENVKTLSWESLVDSLFKLSDSNQSIAIKAIDSLFSVGTIQEKNRLSELHFIKGDIYYNIDSLEKSVDEFTIAIQTIGFGAPKYLAARAGTYIKLRKFEDALYDLTSAADQNYEYDWNIGNYYEIIGNKDSAIALYNRLYFNDTVYYKKCKDRIIELEKPKVKLVTELIYDDRKRVVLSMNGVN